MSSYVVQCTVQIKNWVSYDAELNRNLKNFTLVAAEDSEGLNHLSFSASCVCFKRGFTSECCTSL